MDEREPCPYVFVWVGETTEVYCGKSFAEISVLHEDRTGETVGVDVDYGYIDADDKVLFDDGQVLSWETIAYYHLGHGVELPEQLMTDYT